jgi:hypothetical protein
MPGALQGSEVRLARGQADSKSRECVGVGIEAFDLGAGREAKLTSMRENVLAYSAAFGINAVGYDS